MRSARQPKRSRSLRAIFAVPAAIALLCLVGLIVALTGDGWRDAVAWVALGLPVAAILWALRARRT